MDIQTQQYLSRLILLYIQGNLNERQSKELEEWRSASEEHEFLFRRLLTKTHWEQSVNDFVKNEMDTQAEWEMIRQRTVGRRRKRLYSHWYRYVAAIVLPLLVGGFVFYLLKSPDERNIRDVNQFVRIVPGSAHAILELADGTCVDLKDTLGWNKEDEGFSILPDSLKYKPSEGAMEYHVLKVPRGAEYTLVLADGTTVYMNADSRLRYPVHFGEGIREVELEGEAFFDVKRDPLHPFVVSLGELEVKVLGTSFGIRAYRDHNQVLTTLVSGHVKVTAAGIEVDLLPDKQAIFDKHLRTFAVKEVDPELFVAWKDGYYQFEQATLEEIMSTLALWYDLNVFYQTPKAKQIEFTGRVRRYDDILTLLKKIEQTEEVRFDIKGNNVIVRSR